MQWKQKHGVVGLGFSSPNDGDSLKRKERNYACEWEKKWDVWKNQDTKRKVEKDKDGICSFEGSSYQFGSDVSGKFAIILF